MWVILRKRLRGVQREYPHSTGVLISCRVNPRLLVSDLDKAVAGDAAILAHLPERRLLVVVDRPDPVKQGRDDVFELLVALEVDSTPEGEVRDVAAKSCHVVHGDVGLAGFTLVRPVVSQVNRMPRRSSSESGVIEARALRILHPRGKSSTRPSGLMDMVRSLAAARMDGETKAMDMWHHLPSAVAGIMSAWGGRRRTTGS